MNSYELYAQYNALCDQYLDRTMPKEYQAIANQMFLDAIELEAKERGRAVQDVGGVDVDGGGDRAG